MTDPSSSSCTSVYSSASTLPAESSALKSCMSDPASTACTSVYSSSSSLPTSISSISSLKSCMTDPSSNSCTSTFSGTSSLPGIVWQAHIFVFLITGKLKSLLSFLGIVTNVDKCMTSVDDADCTASYGATSNLITSGGTGLVGYIHQFSKLEDCWFISINNILWDKS